MLSLTFDRKLNPAALGQPSNWSVEIDGANYSAAAGQSVAGSVLQVGGWTKIVAPLGVPGTSYEANPPVLHAEDGSALAAISEFATSLI